MTMLPRRVSKAEKRNDRSPESLLQPPCAGGHRAGQQGRLDPPDQCLARNSRGSDPPHVYHYECPGFPRGCARKKPVLLGQT